MQHHHRRPEIISNLQWLAAVRRTIVSLVVASLCSVGAQAAVNYDESVSGDLLGGFNALGTLDVGVNTVSGSIAGSSNGDGGDRWDLSLAAGLEIYRIDYSISNFAAVIAGDRGIFAFAPSQFVPQSLTGNGSFTFPAANLPFSGPLTSNDHFFMRDHQILGEEVAYDYVVTIHVRAAGQVISTNTTGNFELMPGDSLTITAGATLSGNVAVNGGVLRLENGATINGSILGTQAGDIVLTGGAKVTGNIEHSGGTLLIDGASTVHGDTIRSNTNHTLIQGGSAILGELVFNNPGLVELIDASVSNGILIDITGAGIHTNADISLQNVNISGNILIDITGAGITDVLAVRARDSIVSGNLQVTMSDEIEPMSEIALESHNTAVNSILIDVTGGGILSTVELSDTDVSQNIVIDITGAGIQGDAAVSLVDMSSGNNIVIDITGAGLTRSVAVSGGHIGNQLQVKGSGEVSVFAASVDKHLKVKQSDSATITDSSIGKNILFQSAQGTCTASGNQVGGKVKGC